MDYLSSAEIAKKWNVSQRRVAVFCKDRQYVAHERNPLKQEEDN